MSVGVVKWFSALKGYGFITLFDGSEVYFHVASIRDANAGTGWATGTPVEFDVIQTRTGPEATNVRCSALSGY